MTNIRALIEDLSANIYRWRRRGATLALCLMAVWVAYHVVFGANGMMIYAHKRAEHRSLNKEIFELQQENQRLAHQVDALKSDPKTIEKEAREQLRYARPGEVIYTLPQASQRPATVTAEKR
jgi:cell division protein FtsB